MTKRSYCYPYKGNGSLLYALGVVFLSLIVGTVSGCSRGTMHTVGRNRSGSQVSGPITLYAGIDDSLSQTQRLGASKLFVSRVSGRLAQDRDRLIVYRAGHVTEEIYNNAPRSMERMLQTLNHELSAPDPRPGTFPEPFWTSVAANAIVPGAPIIVVFCSDGENSDQTEVSRRAIKDAGAVLARSPRVRAVLVVGIRAGQRGYLRDCLAPLGDRVYFFGEAENDFARVKQIIASTRTVPATPAFPKARP
jgi:hypothetical protein